MSILRCRTQSNNRGTCALWLAETTCSPLCPDSHARPLFSFTAPAFQMSTGLRTPSLLSSSCQRLVIRPRQQLQRFAYHAQSSIRSSSREGVEVSLSEAVWCKYISRADIEHFFLTCSRARNTDLFINFDRSPVHFTTSSSSINSPPTTLPTFDCPPNRLTRKHVHFFGSQDHEGRHLHRYGWCRGA